MKILFEVETESCIYPHTSSLNNDGSLGNRNLLWDIQVLKVKSNFIKDLSNCIGVVGQSNNFHENEDCSTEHDMGRGSDQVNENYSKESFIIKKNENNKKDKNDNREEEEKNIKESKEGDGKAAINNYSFQIQNKDDAATEILIDDKERKNKLSSIIEDFCEETEEITSNDNNNDHEFYKIEQNGNQESVETPKFRNTFENIANETKTIKTTNVELEAENKHKTDQARIETQMNKNEEENTSKKAIVYQNQKTISENNKNGEIMINRIQPSLNNNQDRDKENQGEKENKSRNEMMKINKDGNEKQNEASTINTNKSSKNVAASDDSIECKTNERIDIEEFQNSSSKVGSITQVKHETNVNDVSVTSPSNVKREETTMNKENSNTTSVSNVNDNKEGGGSSLTTQNIAIDIKVKNVYQNEKTTSEITMNRVQPNLKNGHFTLY